MGNNNEFIPGIIMAVIRYGNEYYVWYRSDDDIGVQCWVSQEAALAELEGQYNDILKMGHESARLDFSLFRVSLTPALPPHELASILAPPCRPHRLIAGPMQLGALSLRRAEGERLFEQGIKPNLPGTTDRSMG